MGKIAVVGDYDSIYGFSTLGLDIYPVGAEDNPYDVMKRVTSGVYGVVYITEALAEKVPKVIEKYSGAISPAIILIPGTSGNTGKGIANVKKTVEQAVGSDILFGSNDQRKD